MPAFSEYRLQSKYPVVHYETFQNTLRFEGYFDPKKYDLKPKVDIFLTFTLINLLTLKSKKNLKVYESMTV